MGRIFIIGVILLVGGIVSLSTGAGFISGLAIVGLGFACLGTWVLWSRRRGSGDIPAKLRRPRGGHWRNPAP